MMNVFKKKKLKGLKLHKMKHSKNNSLRPSKSSPMRGICNTKLLHLKKTEGK